MVIARRLMKMVRRLSSRTLSFQLKDVLRISIINDDALGPTHLIVFELMDGSEHTYATGSERRAVARWVKGNIPSLTGDLRRYLRAKSFEDYLIAVLYESAS